MTASESRRTLAQLDPALVHPALGIGASIELRSGRWSGPMATYAATLTTLADSERMADEFAAALAVLNPLLDARLFGDGERGTVLDARAGAILRCAEAVRDARSGMGCDLALSYLDLALDDARAELGAV